MGEEVIHKTVGYSWKIGIKRTIRIPGKDPKYADTTEIEAELAGNESCKEDQNTSISSAKNRLEELTK